MKYSNGNDAKAYGWGCFTLFAVMSVIIALGYYAIWLRDK